jgi:starch synthase
MELMTLSGLLSWIPALRVMATTTYSLDTLPLGKPASKAVFQRELGLPVCNEVPLIGFIQHLDYQKGMDWLAGAMPWMMDQDLQLVMLGRGYKDLEDMLHHFEGCYFDKVCGWVGLSIKTARHITAGADILLMLSCFEPCGLNQLNAMRYGIVLVVQSVGGLQEIVQLDPFTASGMGWTFDRAEVGGFTDALKNAMWTYCDLKNSWIGIKEARNVTGSEHGTMQLQQYEEVLLAAKYSQ